jgi:Suppressor of fused protein (SUFU)
MDEITQHIRAHVGQPLEEALREIVGLLRIQVVPASEERPYQTLITTGMSENAMTAPAGMEDYRYAEVFLHLPKDWPLTKSALRDPNVYWPVEWLRLVAHYPENSPVMLANQNTIGNGEPFAPNTSLSCMMLLRDPTGFGQLRLQDGRNVHFYQLVPLYEEERVLKKEKGTAALLKLFQQHRISEIIDPKRINVARG